MTLLGSFFLRALGGSTFRTALAKAKRVLVRRPFFDMINPYQIPAKSILPHKPGKEMEARQ
jgi:hypothetical protein